jgi:hypothetical protein
MMARTSDNARGATGTQWNPVPQLDIGLEVLYSQRNTAFKGAAFVPASGSRPPVTVIDDQGVWSAMVRWQRNSIHDRLNCLPTSRPPAVFRRGLSLRGIQNQGLVAETGTGLFCRSQMFSPRLGRRMAAADPFRTFGLRRFLDLAGRDLRRP